MEPLQTFFSKVLAKFIFKKPVKVNTKNKQLNTLPIRLRTYIRNFFFQVLVLVLTATAFGLNTWGSVLMRQEFNPLWFIPKSTYLSQYFSALSDFYPSNGEMANIYVKTTNIHQQLADIDGLVNTLNNESAIVSRLDSWLDGFKQFTHKRYSISNQILFFVCIKLICINSSLPPPWNQTWRQQIYRTPFSALTWKITCIPKSVPNFVSISSLAANCIAWQIKHRRLK